MLVAREALNLVDDMVHALSRAGDDAMPEAAIQAQYIAIIAMLRSVGHILEKVDCGAAPDNQFLNGKWTQWKKEKIFAKFIEPARNDLLKEFKAQFRVRLRGRRDIHHVIAADQSARTGATVAASFDPETLVDMHGHEVMPLFREAIYFWDACLKEVEEFQEARSSTQ